MSDSDFWRELAEKFRAIEDPFDLLHAEWKKFDKQPWTLVDEAITRRPQRASIAARFEPLARRCGTKLDSTRDSLHVWLNAMKTEGRWTEHEVHSNLNELGETIDNPILIACWIVRLCQSSADYCNILEARAIESERLATEEEKRKNDPTNWPEIVQQYEVFKSIKGLISGPHEKIPEDVLRNLVAQQDGITPEEVTFDRLRFAVTQLFQHYPAITLVPTARPEQSDSVLVDSKESIAAAPESICDDKTLTNRDRIDAFIGKLLQHGTKINRTDIWLVAGYEDRSEFERFQRVDPRVTKRATRVFNEILALSPQEFLKRLKARRS